MIVFLSAQHKNRISVPQKNINKKSKIWYHPPHLLKRIFLCRKSTLGGGPFLDICCIFFIFRTACKAKHFIFSSKDRRYARFDNRNGERKILYILRYSYLKNDN